MNIAIFGGSFNPVTKAHVEIAKHAIKELELDKLFFVPNHVSPFKKKDKSVIDSKHRVNMLELVKPKNTEISLFEVNRKGVSYTADTVKYFKTKYPEAKIYVLIGTDQLVKLGKWKYIEVITELAQFAIFKRNKKFSKENIKKYGCKLLNNEIFEGSSTLVREGDYKYVEKSVNEYIGQNYLYTAELLVKMLDNQRHKHSYAVADMAARLAKQVGYDPKKAYMAGLMHDITKCKPKEWHREFLKRHGIKREVNDFELHSLSGSIWVEKVYLLNDQEIISSILKHTSLAMELTILDKIIYAADKLCEGRNYQGIQEDRKLIYSDFDAGFKNIVKKTWEFLEENRGKVSPEKEEIYLKWTK